MYDEKEEDRLEHLQVLKAKGKGAPKKKKTAEGEYSTRNVVSLGLLTAYLQNRGERSRGDDDMDIWVRLAGSVYIMITSIAPARWGMNVCQDSVQHSTSTKRMADCDLGIGSKDDIRRNFVAASQSFTASSKIRSATMYLGCKRSTHFLHTPRPLKLSLHPPRSSFKPWGASISSFLEFVESSPSVAFASGFGLSARLCPSCELVSCVGVDPLEPSLLSFIFIITSTDLKTPMIMLCHGLLHCTAW
jgi:hypothetical protein